MQINFKKFLARVTQLDSDYIALQGTEEVKALNLKKGQLRVIRVATDCNLPYYRVKVKGQPDVLVSKHEAFFTNVLCLVEEGEHA